MNVYEKWLLVVEKNSSEVKSKRKKIILGCWDRWEKVSLSFYRQLIWECQVCRIKCDPDVHYWFKHNCGSGSESNCFGQEYHHWFLARETSKSSVWQLKGGSSRSPVWNVWQGPRQSLHLPWCFLCIANFIHKYLFRQDFPASISFTLLMAYIFRKNNYACIMSINKSLRFTNIMRN